MFGHMLGLKCTEAKGYGIVRDKTLTNQAHPRP